MVETLVDARLHREAGEVVDVHGGGLHDAVGVEENQRLQALKVVGEGIRYMRDSVPE